MPFKSKAQQRYLFAKEPEVAKEFAKHMSKKKYKRLPEHVSKTASTREEILKALAYTGGGGGLGALVGYALAGRPLLGAGIGAGAGLGTYAAVERPFSTKVPELKVTPQQTTQTPVDLPRIAPTIKSAEPSPGMTTADKIEAGADVAALGMEGNFWRNVLKSGKYADFSMPAAKGLSKALVPFKFVGKAAGPAIMPLQLGTDMFFDRNWKPSWNVPHNMVDNAGSTLDALRGQSYKDPMTYLRGAVEGLNAPRTITSLSVGTYEPIIDTIKNWWKSRELNKQEDAINKRKALSILSKQSSVSTTGQAATPFGAATDIAGTTLKGAKSVAGVANKAVTAANVTSKAVGSTIQPIATAANKAAPTMAAATAIPRLTQVAAYAKPLTAAYVGFNTAENMFKDPQTGEWNTNVGKNFSGNTENAIQAAGNVDPYSYHAVLNGFSQGGSNPVGTLAGTVKATSDIVSQNRENARNTVNVANNIDTVNQRLAMHNKPLVPKEQQYVSAQPKAPAPTQQTASTPTPRTTQARDWRAFL